MPGSKFPHPYIGGIPVRPYIKYEFCRAMECPFLISVTGMHWSQSLCYQDPENCHHTAKEFHSWLTNNGFAIIKTESHPNG